MRLKLNHFWVPIYVSLALSIITIIATSLFGNWSPIYIYNIFYFTFFNFTILSLNTIFFTKHRRFLNTTARKFLRILVIVVYSLIYLTATISFIKTGQIAGIQTAIFFSQMAPTIMTITIIAFIIAATLLLTFALYKKTKPDKKEVKERNKIKIIFYISIALFIITILANSMFLQFKNPLISDKEALISYQAKPIIQGEELLQINLTLENPNVIFIMVDAISAENVGAYGYERNVTPNIDALTQESILFKNAYATSTHSDYSQPAILSSRHMLTSEYRTIFPYENPKKFIWDTFKEDNYTTGYYSSQDDRWQNMNYYLNYTNLDNISNSMTDNQADYGIGLLSNDYDHKTTNLALNWLNETIKKPNPFFLYLNFQATHSPRSYPPEYAHFKPDEDNSLIPFAEDNSINRYDNALRYVDAQIGRIINFTKENNISNNTIIVFTSDHGEDLKARHGLTDHGKSIYNEELIVPLIIHIPNTKPTIVEHKVSQIDITPTLINLLGFPIPDEFQGDIMQKNSPIFFVTQSHKYLIGMVQNETKIILNIERETSEIYNLKNDPEELNELNPKNYRNEILKLLFWHHCQKDYYANERWKSKTTDNRCVINNNFKI